MPDGQLIEFTHVTKRFGAVTAVSDFSAQASPGIVTGFLGPNGAGKTTTLRMLLGLVRPTAGTATIGGSLYRDLKFPLQTVGAALEASSFHPGRSAANHLKVSAQAAGIPRSRIDDVLDLVGLSDVAGRKVGGYSLGMRQRLGLATALLGDPGVIVLDEPTNGLDPEGIRWMRTFLRQLAREGRTVLTSSHLLAEVQQTAHALIIIAAGRLVFSGRLYELSAQEETSIVVDSHDRAALVQALRDVGLPFEVLRAGLSIRGGDSVQIGAVAAHAGVALSTLQKRLPSLEEVFLELVSGLRVHPSAAGIAGTLEAGAGVPDADDELAAAPEAGGIAEGALPESAGAEAADTEEAGAEEPVATTVSDVAASVGATAVAGFAAAEVHAPENGVASENQDSEEGADAEDDAAHTNDATETPGTDGSATAGRRLPGLAGFEAAAAAFLASQAEDENDEEAASDAVATSTTEIALIERTPRPAPEPESAPPSTSVFHVATTGIIDVVDTATESEHPDDTDSHEEGEQR